MWSLWGTGRRWGGRGWTSSTAPSGSWPSPPTPTWPPPRSPSRTSAHAPAPPLATPPLTLLVPAAVAVLPRFCSLAPCPTHDRFPCIPPRGPLQVRSADAGQHGRRPRRPWRLRPATVPHHRPHPHRLPPRRRARGGAVGRDLGRHGPRLPDPSPAALRLTSRPGRPKSARPADWRLRQGLRIAPRRPIRPRRVGSGVMNGENEVATFSDRIRLWLAEWKAKSPFCSSCSCWM